MSSLFIISASFGQEKQDIHSWKFIKEEDGIRVYTGNVDSSSLKSFKGVAYMRSSVDEVISVLSNTDDFDWWDENVQDIDILEYKANKNFSYYFVYDIPWPFSDRDACVKARITRDPESGTGEILTESLPEVIPERKGLVRMTSYRQRWLVKPYGDGMVEVIMEGFIDPGGQIPSWIYNMALTKTPLNVMKKVRERVEN